MQIGIFIYDGAEVLDFSGPYEVFATAARLGATHLQPRLLAEADRLVEARGGFCVQPHGVIGASQPPDVIVVAGGEHEAPLGRAKVIDALADAAAPARIVASVCTGAFLLAQTGLLDGRRVTTHWADQTDLAERFPALVVERERRWVHDGRFVTSGGISAGIDMSLYLVSILIDPETAHRTARQMEYDWRVARG